MEFYICDSEELPQKTRVELARALTPSLREATDDECMVLESQYACTPEVLRDILSHAIANSDPHFDVGAEQNIELHPDEKVWHREFLDECRAHNKKSLPKVYRNTYEATQHDMLRYSRCALREYSGRAGDDAIWSPDLHMFDQDEWFVDNRPISADVTSRTRMGIQLEHKKGQEVKDFLLGITSINGKDIEPMAEENFRKRSDGYRIYFPCRNLHRLCGFFVTDQILHKTPENLITHPSHSSLHPLQSFGASFSSCTGHDELYWR